MNDKINSQHLERAAYVYIRQSTLQQVQNNVESSRRQYALEERARFLGFESVVVIDDDLGLSGAGSRARPGQCPQKRKQAVGTAIHPKHWSAVIPRGAGNLKRNLQLFVQSASFSSHG
jgi:hypothetical protein